MHPLPLGRNSSVWNVVQAWILVMGVMPSHGVVSLMGALSECFQVLLWALSSGSHLSLCPWAPLGMLRWAFDGLMVGLGEARGGYYWDPPLAAAFLCSLVGMTKGAFNLTRMTTGYTLPFESKLPGFQNTNWGCVTTAVLYIWRRWQHEATTRATCPVPSLPCLFHSAAKQCSRSKIKMIYYTAKLWGEGKRRKEKKELEAFPI